MPLQKLQVAPGIDKQNTEYGAEGRWVDSDNVRFRYGQPEKIGGWEKVSSDALLGATRAILTWSSNAGVNYAMYGTNKKLYAYSEGDYGDSLFIVVNGKVKIHKGAQELALLEKGACLGEMALLDDEPRSADATITEESTLFKIEREGFYEVMAGQTVIMQGIIKLLTGRLRVANEKLMSK